MTENANPGVVRSPDALSEPQARAVLLLQAHEQAVLDGAPTAHWDATDAAWATQQALAALGPQATPERFVAARSAAAMSRLLPREPAAATWVQAPLSQRLWIGAALLLGAAIGLAIDQLGPPQRVNLLAPALWAVVLWNLGVVVATLLRALRLEPAARLDKPAGVGSDGTAGVWLIRLAGAGTQLLGSAGSSAIGEHNVPRALREAQHQWARRAAPLLAERAALVFHLAATALAAGLIAGLYLRGLGLDYRAGWQSTFLDAPTVQTLLNAALAPAATLTGIAVPAVAPLRLGPMEAASASAAPWIHLLAATLFIAVVLPRGALAAWALWRARRLERAFPLPLVGRYFEGLHPLMRRGRPPVLRLAWLDVAGSGAGLFGQPPPDPGAVRTLIETAAGERLELHQAAPPTAAGLATATGWFAKLRRWFGAQAAAAAPRALEADAVLLVATADAERPAWLVESGLPLVWLVDQPDVGAAGHGVPAGSANGLPLRARDDGWWAEGRLLAALEAALPGDLRLERLATHWRAEQAQRARAVVAAGAQALAEAALAREDLPEGNGLLGRRGDAEAARQALLVRLADTQRRLDERICAALGRPEVVATSLPAAAGSQAVAVGPDGSEAQGSSALAPALSAAVHQRVGEGRAALLGGALGGALVGLKADLATGGLTLGTGALAGGVIGALGAAGAARGLNVVRGTGRSHVDWDDAALAAIAESALTRVLVLAWRPAGLAATEQAALGAALQREQARLATLWRSHREGRGGDAAGDEAGRAAAADAALRALAVSLERPLADLMQATLGGPAVAGR